MSDVDVKQGKVTVIIPAYNNANFIAECICSVRDETSVCEIILIDNSSTDGTAEAAERLDLHNLRIIRNKENVGAARARHQGVQNCSSNYLVFLDSDDFLSPGAIDDAFDSITNDNVDMSLFRLMRVDERGSNPEPLIDAPSGIIKGREAFSLAIGPWRIHTLGMLSRELYDQAVKDFDFHGFFADELLSRRFLLNANRVGPNQGIYFYRHVPKQISYEKVLGQTITNVEVAVLATAAGFSPLQVAPARAVAARALASLAFRTRSRRQNAHLLQDLIARIRNQPFSWSSLDLRARALLLAASILAPRPKS